MCKNNKRVKPIKMRGHMLINSMMRFKHISRSGVYRWLASQMNLTEEEVHFAVMNEDRCKQAVNIMRKEATRIQNARRRKKCKDNKKSEAVCV